MDGGDGGPAIAATSIVAGRYYWQRYGHPRTLRAVATIRPRQSALVQRLRDDRSHDHNNDLRTDAGRFARDCADRPAHGEHAGLYTRSLSATRAHWRAGRDL